MIHTFCLSACFLLKMGEYRNGNVRIMSILQRKVHILVDYVSFYFIINVLFMTCTLFLKINLRGNQSTFLIQQSILCILHAVIKWERLSEKKRKEKKRKEKKRKEKKRKEETRLWNSRHVLGTLWIIQMWALSVNMKQTVRQILVTEPVWFSLWDHWCSPTV